MSSFSRSDACVQVTNFLIHGGYEQSRELERFLLGKSSRYGLSHRAGVAFSTEVYSCRLRSADFPAGCRVAVLSLKRSHGWLARVTRAYASLSFRSIQFAHRMYWFLNAYARSATYVSEIRRRDPSTSLVVPAPLLEAVAIEASWAGAFATTR